MKEPHPRSLHLAKDTWLEPEELTYPSGGFHRRARAYCPGERAFRIVKCSIPDTYFTIPARARIQGKTVKGYVMDNEGVLEFHPERQTSK